MCPRFGLTTRSGGPPTCELRWAGLTHLLEDGRIAIDNNIVGRSTLPLAQPRRNRQFAGGDRWATRASLIEAA
ncbi:IS66 family transposase [Phenylobacterium sp.]|uniref:IS66 family transposase n=1 Tax=Phenylobacterium sp. TaxID=1871053 RepID=UPI003FA6989A